MMRRHIGLLISTRQLHGKQLQILKATLPNLSRVAIRRNPTSSPINLPSPAAGVAANR
jgi:hypothetical protein